MSKKGAVMRSVFLISASACILWIGGCADKVLPTVSSCEPAGYSEESLLALRENGFNMGDDAARQTLARAMVTCLSDRNPDIRDGVAYEGLATWLRNKELNAETIRRLKQTLLEMVQGPGDNDGFEKPFAALILAEIARVDRTTPFMNNYDRTGFVKEAAGYMRRISDYRGYSDNNGWRHNVAHTADWLMQLSLNEKITPADFVDIREAIGSQVRANRHHAYIHGEPARMARPILFLARRGAFTEAEWTAWIEEISAPAPLDSWSAAFRSESGLAQRHNVKQFLHALYLNASLSEDENTRRLLPGVKEALRKIP